MKAATILLLPAVCLTLGSCGKKPVTAQAPAESPQTSLATYFTDTAPPSPAQISVIRTTAKPGDAVIVTGLVMGRDHPFVDGRAALVLGDRTVLTPCNAKPGDGCATPWDTCCDTKEDKQRATATIQLVGKDGRVLKTGLKGAGGLKELSAVTLTGTVDKASTPEALIINASQMHVSNP